MTSTHTSVGPSFTLRSMTSTSINMRNSRGFTLVELMIALAIAVMAGMMMWVAVNSTNEGSNLSWGINGVSETRCMNGYLFVVGPDGSMRQVMDQLGRGARCETV